MRQRRSHGLLAAPEHRQPDRLPYLELFVDRMLARQLLGWSEAVAPSVDLEHNPFTHGEMRAVADHLGLDTLFYVMRAPVYVEHIAGKDGRVFYGDGLNRVESALSMMSLPYPTDPRLYDEAQAFVAAKGERVAAFVTRAGISPTLLSMGMEGFSVALYENRPFLETILDRYFDWSIEVAERVCRLGFDLYVTTDDVAHKSGPLFSPEVFHELSSSCSRTSCRWASSASTRSRRARWTSASSRRATGTGYARSARST